VKHGASDKYLTRVIDIKPCGAVAALGQMASCLLSNRQPTCVDEAPEANADEKCQTGLDRSASNEADPQIAGKPS